MDHRRRLAYTARTVTLFGPNKRKQAKAKRLAKEMRLRVLKHCEDYTAKEAGKLMGLGPNDMANLRAGNGVSLLMLVRIIKNGRFTPNSLLSGKTLRRLRTGTSTRGVRAESITKRICKIALDGPPQHVARKTGLAAVTLYQFRTQPPNIVSLHTVLSFIEAGYSTDQLILGRK